MGLTAVLEDWLVFQAEDGIRDYKVAGVQTCFFVQAEYGIRDYKVTGVQTCARPIWGRVGHANACGARLQRHPRPRRSAGHGADVRREVLRRGAAARGGNSARDRPGLRGRRRGAIPAAVETSGQQRENDVVDERRGTGRGRTRTRDGRHPHHGWRGHVVLSRESPGYVRVRRLGTTRQERLATPQPHVRHRRGKPGDRDGAGDEDGGEISRTGCLTRVHFTRCPTSSPPNPPPTSSPPPTNRCTGTRGARLRSRERAPRISPSSWTSAPCGAIGAT